MFALKGRQDFFRLILPDNFIVPEIEEKYTNIIKEKKSFLYKPIDFINETIQGIQILGFQEASIPQQQPARGYPIIDENRVRQNNFLHTSSDYNYRAEKSPLAILDKTLNVTFRHTLGFLNYFILFENFWYQYSRDRKYKDLPEQFNIELMNNIGEVYSKIIIYDPIINSMDMLDMNYTQPIAQSQTFNLTFKYSNIDYQFINHDKEEL